MSRSGLVLHRLWLTAAALTLLLGIGTTGYMLPVYVHDAVLRDRAAACLAEATKAAKHFDGLTDEQMDAWEKAEAGRPTNPHSSPPGLFRERAKDDGSPGLFHDRTDDFIADDALFIAWDKAWVSRCRPTQSRRSTRRWCSAHGAGRASA